MQIDANKIIDDLGGTVEVSKLCHVTAQAVSQCRASGIPAARLMFLKLYRPDLFMQKEAA
jgi:citrate lyase beta subunit